MKICLYAKPSDRYIQIDEERGSYIELKLRLILYFWLNVC